MDGIPDSYDADSYAPHDDADMDGISDYDDFSTDNHIMDNFDNDMEATNVWTDDGP